MIKIEIEKFIQSLQRNKFIILLLFIIFLLRLPSLFEPYWYGDEGVYLTLGLAIKKGFLLYRDVFDNKPPLIYLLAALAGGTIFWFRFLLTISALATIWFFYQLGKRLKINEKAKKVATIIFSLLITLPLIEGNIANAEIFILLPTIVGLYFLSPHLFPKEKLTLSPIKIFVTGIILGTGLLLKVPSIFDFIAIMSFLILFQKRDILVNFGKKEILLVLGYLSPILIISLFFLTKNAFTIFFRSCFLQTVGYLSSWETGSHAFSLDSFLKSRLILNVLLAFLLTSCLWLMRKRINNLVVFLAIWFLFALFSTTLSGRPYPHYLLQIVPPFSLIIGLLFAKQAKKDYLVLVITVILLISVYFRYRFWAYPTFSYYHNFIKFVIGEKDKIKYFSFFSPKMPQTYQLAEFIAASTQYNDKIFIWADEPYLYPLSRRLPAIPYVVAYHIIERNLYQAAGRQLSSTKPALIIVNSDSKRFPELESILSTEYLNIYSIDNFTVFKRMAL